MGCLEVCTFRAQVLLFPLLFGPKHAYVLLSALNNGEPAAQCLLACSNLLKGEDYPRPAALALGL